MNNRIVENVVYEYRYSAVEQEIRSKIPNISHLDALRRSCLEDKPRFSPLNQILVRVGMLACVGIIYYLVTVVV